MPKSVVDTNPSATKDTHLVARNKTIVLVHTGDILNDYGGMVFKVCPEQNRNNSIGKQQLYHCKNSSTNEL